MTERGECILTRIGVVPRYRRKKLYEETDRMPKQFGSAAPHAWALWVLLLALPLSACGHARASTSEAVREAADAYLSSTPEDERIVSPAWLARELAEGRGEDLTIVDTRARTDYANGHIPGAIHVPFKSAARAATLERLPRGRPLIVVCKSGHTGSMVNAIWNMLGYQALTLKGGMRGWADAHGPVEAGETEGRR